MLSAFKAELARLEETDSGAAKVGPSLFQTWARLNEGAALWESTIGPAQAEVLGLSRETLQAGYLLVVDFPEPLETTENTSAVAVAEEIGEIFDRARNTVVPVMDAAIARIAHGQVAGGEGGREGTGNGV